MLLPASSNQTPLNGGNLTTVNDQHVHCDSDFNSPTEKTGPIAVPSLDSDFIRLCENSTTPRQYLAVDNEETYLLLQSLTASDSEAGSPRPRRHLKALQKAHQTTKPLSIRSHSISPPHTRARSAPARRKRVNFLNEPQGGEGEMLDQPAENLFGMPRWLLNNVISFCGAKDITCFARTCKAFDAISRSSPAWQRLVFEDFGFKYQNYSLYTGENDWCKLYSKAATFVRNLRLGQPKQFMFDKLLDPVSVPNYDGCLALAPDNRVLLWENGEIIQAVDIKDGREMFRISVLGERTDSSKPCLVNTKSHAFFHLNGRIQVFCLATGCRVTELVLPNDETWHAAEFSLDASTRNNQLAFLTTKAVHVWDATKLQYLYKIIHLEADEVGSSGDLDFLWSGFRCGICLHDPAHEHCDHMNQRMDLTPALRSRHLVTWLKKKSPNLQIHDSESGCVIGTLYGDSGNVVRVRQCTNLSDIAHYFIATLTDTGIVSIWDSRGFRMISKLHTGEERCFRLSLTPQHLFVMSDGSSTTHVDFKMWRFDQPSKDQLKDYLANPPETVTQDEKHNVSYEGIVMFKDVRSCRLPSNVYFCDVIDNRFLALWYSTFKEGTTRWSLCQSNWEVYDSLQFVYPGKCRHPPKTEIRHEKRRSFSISEMGLPPAFRGVRSQRRSSALSLFGRGETNEAKSPSNYLLSGRCFRMLNRADTWSLLDWKSLSILGDGSLMVYDFSC
eukprot:GHVN01067512.1.p1 GENE.GHVN01067512.1~~GHVN01067512.1.p1  ORF type:complete len:726 (+),score=32.84 GHVN01067512.1:1506-3683(+)